MSNKSAVAAAAAAFAHDPAPVARAPALVAVPPLPAADVVPLPIAKRVRRDRSGEDDLPNRRRRSSSSRNVDVDRTDRFRVRARDMKVLALDVAGVARKLESRARAPRRMLALHTTRVLLQVAGAVSAGVVGAFVVAFVLLAFFGS